MANFSIREAVTGAIVDTRWRTSAHGEDSARPGQIAVADFEDVIGLVNPGYIPSGVALAKQGDKLVPLEDGGDLFGFINDNEGVEVLPGDTYATVAVLRHGMVDPNFLPVEEQRDVVRATTNGNFIISVV